MDATTALSATISYPCLHLEKFGPHRPRRREAKLLLPQDGGPPRAQIRAGQQLRIAVGHPHNKGILASHRQFPSLTGPLQQICLNYAIVTQKTAGTSRSNEGGVRHNERCNRLLIRRLKESTRGSSENKQGDHAPTLETRKEQT
jgi:hypothetical protein